VRDGASNGVWFTQRHMWVQNEDTNRLPDLVDRRAYDELLKHEQPTARSPQASLAAIHLRPEFQVELMVSEPLIMDPVAMAFGPDGKLWVVEMGDYPLGTDG